MPRYATSYKRTSISSSTGAVSENAIVFSQSGGHSHDGQGSSLIDTTKYSIWDFPVNTVYSTTPRAARQAAHIEQFKNFVVNLVNTSVLEPAGVVLGDNVINANNIVAGSISSELIAANTIVANNIAANTITTELLATNAITSLNYSYSSGNYSNAGTFFDLSDGSITSEQFYIDNAGNAGFKGSINLGTYNYWNSNGTFSVGNASESLTWNGSSLSLTGDISLGTYNYWTNGGDFRVGGASEYLFWDQSAGTLRVTGDIILDSNNYWYRGSDFRIGNSTKYVFWDQSAGTLNVRGNIYAENGTFTGSITSSATITGGEIAAGTFSLSAGSTTRIRFGTSYSAGINLEGGTYGDIYVGFGVANQEGNRYNVPDSYGYHIFSGRTHINRTTYGSSWNDQQFAVIGTGNAGMAIRAGTNTGTVQFRVGYNFTTLYVRNHNDTAYWPIACGTVNANGDLNATGTKPFVIPHPILKDVRLRHTAVEAPAADLIYRGVVNLKNGRAEVNIDKFARMTEGTFVALCRNVSCFTSNESDWSAVKGVVNGNVLTIEAENLNSRSTVSWLVIGERNDSEIKKSDSTDDDGVLITEFEKPEYEID